MIKKILLIQPPYNILKFEPKGAQPPLGLAYIAAVLENKYAVKIIDCVIEGYDTEKWIDNNFILYGLPEEEIENRIREFQPDIVGVSCLFSTQSENAHMVCRLAKQVSPKIITVMGGAHPSSLPEVVLTDTNVDYAVIGEAEESFPALIESLQQNPPNLSSIDGLAYRINGALKIQPKTRYIDNLDSLPFPARHLLPMEKYFKIDTPMGNLTRRKPSTCMITSRGCTANCIFCSIHTVWGRKYRYRSVENVVLEIKQLIATYGVRELQFCDDNLTLNKERAKKLFRTMIDENFNLLWTTPNGTAIWTLDDELLELMKQSGLYKISVAIESGDDYILHEVIQKPVDLKKVGPIIKKIRALKMGMDVFFVVGLPGETRAQIEKTLDFARNLKADNLSIAIAAPHPGTRLWKICQEKGYLKDLDFRNIRSRLVNIETPDITPEELDKMVSWINLTSRLKNLLFNPAVFYERVLRRLFKDPRFFFALTEKTVANILKLRKEKKK